MPFLCTSQHFIMIGSAKGTQTFKLNIKEQIIVFNGIEWEERWSYREDEDRVININEWLKKGRIKARQKFNND